MLRCRTTSLLVVLAATLQCAAMIQAQSPFDPPPAPTGGPPTPAVRGLYDPTQPAPSPAGIEEAPPATFIAPGGGPTTPQPPTGVVQGDGVAPESRPIAGSEIIARADGQVILASDVLWQANQIIHANRDRIPPEQVEEVRKMLLRQQLFSLVDANMTFLDSKLLFADFVRNVPAENLPKIEEQIAEGFEKQELPRLIKMLKVKDRAELDDLFRASGTSVKDVQKQFLEKIVAGEWLRQRTPKSKPVTHEEILAYYQDHLKEYEYPAQVRWEEIMVRFDRVEGGRDAAWQKLAEMGNEVWQAAAKNPNVRGPVFAGVAKEKSHGFTADEGGIHDWTPLDSLACQDMNTALATLALGQMSDGIESPLGFHIVRVLERKEAGRTPFTEAQEAIKKLLEQEQKATLVAAEIAKLRENARVWTIFDGDLTHARLAEALDGKRRR